MGYDFSFGWRGEGRPDRLAEYCREHGLGGAVISAGTLEGGVVSSPRSRALLEGAGLGEANRRLGHTHAGADNVT